MACTMQSVGCHHFGRDVMMERKEGSGHRAVLRMCEAGPQGGPRRTGGTGGPQGEGGKRGVRGFARGGSGAKVAL